MRDVYRLIDIRPIQIGIGKKALADPSIPKAVTSLKQNSIKPGTRAINKELGKIAPVQIHL